LCLLAVCVCLAAGDPVAARLAKEARQAQNAGRVVRAYMLFAEAAVRDPHNASYAANREALAPLAKLLSSQHVEDADISEDIKAAEANPGDEADSEAPLDPLPASGPDDLQPPPHVILDNSLHSFDLRLDEKTAITQITEAYGIKAIFDPDFDSKPLGRFTLTQADFRTAMEAITAVTRTFVFPVSTGALFVARDSETKRNEFEPVITVTVPLPDAVDPKEIVEAANAVRGALTLRTISWDSAARTIVVRDHVTRANVARSLLEALLLPKAQCSIEVQLLAIDNDVNYHYGIALPTSFTGYNFFHIGNIQTVLPTLTNGSSLLVFGSGMNFYGIALTSGVLFDATVTVSSGQTASLHVGDKYPIPTSLYTGVSQQTSGSAIYNPVGQVTQEDLGLVLKIGATVDGDGDISLDTEAQYKSLGNEVYQSVPAINQREFKGSVRLREGEYAIIAGLEQDDHTSTRNGLLGLSQIPGLAEIFSENTRDHSTSNTLILLKPVITRLPMSSIISPQFLLGALRGSRVLL
jgi:general secretion pathway protein D